MRLQLDRQFCSGANDMTAEEALIALVHAIEDIEANWEKGNLAEAVNRAVSIKDEVCCEFYVPLP